MYSITDRKTFGSLENWLKQINESQPENIAKIIVGNKCDCTDAERQVSKEEGEALANKYGVTFVESSAKDNYNISEIFTRVGASIKEKLLENEQKPNPSNIKIKSQIGNKKEKKNC